MGTTAINVSFDAYINVNILLMFLLALWLASRGVMKLFGLSHAYTAQLHLMHGILLTIVISPFVVPIISAISQTWLLPENVSMNLADFVVSQYLQGSFEMNASLLEQVLIFRSQMTSDILNLNNQLGYGIVAFVLAGVLFFTSRLLLSIFKLYRVIGTSFTWRKIGNLHLCLSDTTTVPFSTRTFRKRYVVIPSAMLTNQQDLRIALGHEFQHLRQFDVEWEIGMELLKPLFFWNPAYYLWKHQIDRLRELSCDQQVLARKGFDVATYCECLLRVCHNSLRSNRLFSVEVPKVALVKIGGRFSGRRSAAFLRRRMLSLLEGRSKGPTKMALACLMAPLVTVAIVSSVAIHKGDDWSQDRIMLSTIVNLERLAVRNNSDSGLNQQPF